MMKAFEKASLEEIAQRILLSGAVEVRDVDGGAEPFIYSTGNRGPGYVMIKGLVGQPETLIFLCRQLAWIVIEKAKFNFIEGNATGGMVPAWQLRNEVYDLLGRTTPVPYAYLREARKEGGHGELITGIGNNPLIKVGMSVLIVEELVNYAGTTTNAARIYREAGYPVSNAACILSYDHQESNEKLKETEISLVPLITLPQLLEVAEATRKLSSDAVRSYRDFLRDPIAWQLQRGLALPEESAKKAIERGNIMRAMEPDEAVRFGAPASKVKQGVRYFWRTGAL